MSIRKPLIFSLCVIALMLGISVWGWFWTPSHAHIPVHWALNFRPNGYAPKTFGLIVIPATAALLTLLFAVLPILEPRRTNLEASRRLYFAGWYGSLVLLLVLHTVIVLTAIGVLVDVPQIIVGATAALILVLGNFLGKSRSTFFVGLRLPWTLSSELAWSKSNRMAGLGFVATGVITLVVLIAVNTRIATLVLLAGLLLSTIVASIASYFYWKHDDNKFNGGSIHD
jgi:uncharacterized membrane protein